MLYELNTLTLANKRIYADMIFTYKCLNSQINFPMTKFGFRVKASITRSNSYQLTQNYSNNNTFANLFSCRAASQWNKFKSDDVVLQQMLFKHLFA